MGGGGGGGGSALVLRSGAWQAGRCWAVLRRRLVGSVCRACCSAWSYVNAGGLLGLAWQHVLKLDHCCCCRAGLFNSIVIGQSSAGQEGSAGDWPSRRAVRGVVTASAPAAASRHTALMAVSNVTFVNFTGGQLYALEACGKCASSEGGSTTVTSGLQFVQPGVPAVSLWSWAHQGIYLDADGSLVNAKNFDLAKAAAWVSAAKGGTMHSGIGNGLFDPAECQAVLDGGMLCKPELSYRRVMLKGAQPAALKGVPLLVTAESSGRSMSVPFSADNADGYMFTVATGRWGPGLLLVLLVLLLHNWPRC